MGCNLDVTKKSSATHAVLLDILTYEITVSNISDVMAENVIVKDLLPEELKFILESVTINNLKCSDENIIAGVNLGIIYPNETKTVEFSAQIINKNSEFLENKSLVEFKYLENNKIQCGYCYSNSDIVFLKNPNLHIEKYSDKKSVQLNDEITYTIKLSNTGDLDLYNVFLIDNLPNSIRLIDSTFSIDNKIVNSVELEKGVMLDNIKIGECKEIKYKTLVVSGGSRCKIKNKTRASYSYMLENGYMNNKHSNEYVCCVDMKISSFKQISLDNFIPIPPQKPDMFEVNEINAKVKINKCNIIKTSVARSTEGQILSGYKLVIHGKLSQIVEYTSCEPDQSVHSTEDNTIFSSYIVLPHDFKIGNKVEVEGVIENIYFSKVDEKTIFSNVALLLVAKLTHCN